MNASIRKVMSANDVGKTASHQAGMLIPKDPPILGFFPKLDQADYNPRQVIRFEDEAGQFWEFAFIWYNNSLHKRDGTRNEYRLTRMTKYLTGLQLEAGDSIRFEHDGEDYRIFAERAGEEEEASGGDGVESKGEQFRLKLTGGWVIVKI